MKVLRMLLWYSAQSLSFNFAKVHYFRMRESMEYWIIDSVFMIMFSFVGFFSLYKLYEEMKKSLKSK